MKKIPITKDFENILNIYLELPNKKWVFCSDNKKLISFSSEARRTYAKSNDDLINITKKALTILKDTGDIDPLLFLITNSLSIVNYETLSLGYGGYSTTSSNKFHKRNEVLDIMIKTQVKLRNFFDDKTNLWMRDEIENIFNNSLENALFNKVDGSIFSLENKSEIEDLEKNIIPNTRKYVHDKILGKKRLLEAQKALGISKIFESATKTNYIEAEKLLELKREEKITPEEYRDLCIKNHHLSRLKVLLSNQVLVNHSNLDWMTWLDSKQSSYLLYSIIENNSNKSSTNFSFDEQFLDFMNNHIKYPAVLLEEDKSSESEFSKQQMYDLVENVNLFGLFNIRKNDLNMEIATITREFYNQKIRPLVEDPKNQIDLLKLYKVVAKEIKNIKVDCNPTIYGTNTTSIHSLCDDVNIIEKDIRYEAKKTLMDNLKNHQDSLLTKLEINLDIKNTESFLKKLKPLPVITPIDSSKVGGINLANFLEI